MTTPNELSDKALGIFAFAIYHQLSSGDLVTAVATADSSGHRGDPAAIAELESNGLARLDGDRLVFTDAGMVMMSQLVDRLRGHW